MKQIPWVPDPKPDPGPDPDPDPDPDLCNSHTLTE